MYVRLRFQRRHNNAKHRTAGAHTRSSDQTPQAGALRRLLLFIGLSLLCPLGFADEIKIAVASNFVPTADVLARQFEQHSEHRVTLAKGSTGKHYAQIKFGAPFDVFLAADQWRPQRLEAERIAVPRSRFTYAIGQLALWSPTPDLVDQEGAILRGTKIKRLAIANPSLAPYGRAAQQILERLKLNQSFTGRLVRGENISQTFHFVFSGNATAGFIALSQIKTRNIASSGSYWLPPQTLYEPIEQQAVLLRESPAARSFLDFLNTPQARAIIRGDGYDLP